MTAPRRESAPTWTNVGFRHSTRFGTDGLIGVSCQMGGCSFQDEQNVVGVELPQASRRNSREVFCRIGRVVGRDLDLIRRGNRTRLERIARHERAGSPCRGFVGNGFEVGACRLGGRHADSVVAREADASPVLSNDHHRGSPGLHNPVIEWMSIQRDFRRISRTRARWELKKEINQSKNQGSSRVPG